MAKINWDDPRERKNYYRKTVLETNGKRIRGLNKRDWTGYCELCGKEKSYLSYHHWDDRNPSKGLWVCHLCHVICEDIDKNGLYVAHLYQEFKNALNTGNKEEKKQAEEKLKINKR